MKPLTEINLNQFQFDVLLDKAQRDFYKAEIFRKTIVH